MSPIKDYKLTVTSELVTVTFADGTVTSYPTDSVELVASAFNSELFTVSSDATNGTTLSWKRVTNRYPTSRDNLLTLVRASITDAKAVGAFSSLTVSGAVTAASVTASGALAGASAALTGAVTSATVTATGAITGASVVTDTISEQTGAAGVTVDGVLLKDNAVTASSGATLGTMTVSSSGALGGTYTTGKRQYVMFEWHLDNITGSYQFMTTTYGTTFGIRVREHGWPETVNWEFITVGMDDFTGTIQTQFQVNGAVTSTQSTVHTLAQFPNRTSLATPFTTDDTDDVYVSARQTAGTTGSELTLTLWGYYEQ